MVPFWVPIVIRHLLFRDHNCDNHPYSTPEPYYDFQGLHIAKPFKEPCSDSEGLYILEPSTGPCLQYEGISGLCPSPPREPGATMVLVVLHRLED